MAGFAGTVRLDLRESLPLMAAGLAFLAVTVIALFSSPLHPLLAGVLSLAVAVVGGRDLWRMRHGGPPGSCRSAEWRGGDRWLLSRCDGRVTPARLHPSSRSLGEAVLLVFRRGTGGCSSTRWLLVLPHMVSDPAALRRVRARLTLEGANMRGLGAT